MGITKSYQRYDAVPSAIISDGALLTVPLWGVTSMSLSESYHLPPIGSSSAKAIVGTHDDTITLTGMLLGAERYAWKFALETASEASKRGSAIAGFTGGAISGLILITSMTIRTDMHVQGLTFAANAAKRDALDVTITMIHMPRPGWLSKLLDVASIGVAALADWGGN